MPEGAESVSEGGPAGATERLRELLGGTDIYLLDQLMKGRLGPGDRILDAGCGGGRNIEPFLRMGYDVWAVDRSPRPVRQALELAREVGAKRPPGWVSRQDAGRLAFRGAAFDVVIASALLHFASDRRRLESMVEELWRVLAPGGLLFVRLASTIGIEDELEPLGDGRYRLPGGNEWTLVDRPLLLQWTERLGGRLVEPVKTTVVDNVRAMTTWCVTKPGGEAAAC